MIKRGPPDGGPFRAASEGMTDSYTAPPLFVM